ncbi:Glucose-6-phosphate 1-dehydrogenase [Fasciola gigantica]|uniref:glucose-6-phosphate dehydrogenase (NADP(+)) n=1 Tax=Fasciola gigantica TaxID=46835 RepID=A0A504YF98_FASGI|nr:Glucose-6-phosphate 1-dehydrogenase [Fasciola gigantica]
MNISLVFAILCVHCPLTRCFSIHSLPSQVRVLRYVEPISMDNVVVGQYVKNPQAKEPPASLSYVDDPTVPNDSITPTYVCMVLYINNERWEGVPFILRAGKGERKLVDNLSVYLNSISPHFCFDTIGYSASALQIAGAIEGLILGRVLGARQFVRNDELREAWRILKPILERLQRERIKPHPYPYGSRDGPPQACELRLRAGYQFSGNYKWPFNSSNNDHSSQTYIGSQSGIVILSQVK